jgi:predicted nuclease of restriction endonuclease-like (RecB) superfamily
MAKKNREQPTRPVVKRGSGYAKLVKAIGQVNTGMVSRAAVAVNQALVLRNWLIGAYIVEFEQNGADRAKYGARLLPTLAKDLRAQAIRGLGAEVLRTCRLFFLSYPGISQTLSGKLELSPELASISQTVSGKSGDGISQPVIDRFALPIPQTVSAESPTPLTPETVLRFSWSHLQELIAIDDPWKRAFFENECLLANWSVRQLRRQIGSLLFERTGLSTNNKAVIEKARKQERQQDFTDLIRDPYVLEFTGLAERPEYLESDLESALLTHLQSFLLELGAGFCFEARQKRVTVGKSHDYIDLVFYHRILRCHVLIDLKIRPFKHGDAGQMNFYLNWWKANAVEDGDNPPVGIILCSDRDEVAVEFATAGMDQKLFVSRYLVALPSVEKLRRFLEADRERIESQMPRPKARKRAPRKPKS